MARASADRRVARSPRWTTPPGATGRLRSLQARIARLRETQPERRAIAFYDSQGTSAWYSIDEFSRAAEDMAANLSGYGLRRGDVALTVLPSGQASATALWAILLMGAIPLLLAPPTLQAQSSLSNLALVLEHVIRKAKPKVVVSDGSLTGVLEEISRRRGSPICLFVEEIAGAAQGPRPPLAFPSSREIAALQLTSGTTGMPRICVWKQGAVVDALDGMSMAMEVEDSDLCLNWTPLYHDMGLVNTFLLSLTSGMPLVMLNPVDFVRKPALWLRGLSETGATLTWSPNFGFAIAASRATEAELAGVRLDRVRAFYNAAERVHHETLLAFHRRFEAYGCRFEALKTNFGCAENVGGATFSDPHREIVVERIDRETMLKRRVARTVPDQAEGTPSLTVVGAGRAHPLLEVAILSRTGRVLPDGTVGEIGLKTPSRMSGYLRDSRATRRAIDGKYLRTGDLGYLRDGEVFWVGRVRERINLRGVKLDPSDLEPILLRIPDLRSGCFAAFGVDDEVLGTQRLVLVSEVREPTSRRPDDLKAEIRQRIFETLGLSVNDVLLVRKGTLSKTSSGKRRHRHFLLAYRGGRLDEFIWSGGPEAVSSDVSRV